MIDTVYSIVVTFNGSQWIYKCLESLGQHKVIVVDNASTDNTIEIIEKNFPETIIVRNAKNLGFGRANNIGLKKALDAGTDYVFLLNQDAWVESDTIEKLIGIQKNHPQFGVLSPIHLSGELSSLDDKFNSFLRREQGKSLLDDLLIYNNKIKLVYPMKFINAAAWLISKGCLERVGGFDPIFPHYGEDNDFLKRCFYHGYKLGVVPDTYIYHDRNRDVKLLDEKLNVDNLYINFLKEIKVIDHDFIKKYQSFQLLTFKKILWMLLSGKISSALIYMKAYYKVRKNKGLLKSNIQASVDGRAFI